VITQYRDGVIAGYTLHHGGEPLPLCGPAHQVYIVERIAPPAFTPPMGLFAYVAAMAQRMWDSAWSDDPSIRSGLAAYEHWISWLADEGRGEQTGNAAALSPRHHVSAAAVIASARGSLSRWLAAIGPSLTDEDERRAAMSWASVCE